MSNQTSIEKRIAALRAEAAGINGQRYVEKGRVTVTKEWNPLGNASSQSLFSQGGGGRRNH